MVSKKLDKYIWSHPSQLTIVLYQNVSNALSRGKVYLCPVSATVSLHQVVDKEVIEKLLVRYDRQTK